MSCSANSPGTANHSVAVNAVTPSAPRKCRRSTATSYHGCEPTTALLPRCLLFRSCRTQDVRQPVVSFVTFVLHDRLVVVHGQRHRERPGARPGGWIVDGDRPDDLVGRNARELLDELQSPGI